MEEKKIENLEKTIMLTGFAVNQYELNQLINSGEKEFQMEYRKSFKEDRHFDQRTASSEEEGKARQFQTFEAVAVLNFKRSDKDDNVFFNSFDLYYTDEENNQSSNQRFEVKYGNKIPLKEAFNLMRGRSINRTFKDKDGVDYNASVYMDFSKTDKHGNYYLQKVANFSPTVALSGYSFTELEQQGTADEVARSLAKGNLTKVTNKLPDGSNEPLLVALDAKFKELRRFSLDMKPKMLSQRENVTQSNEIGGNKTVQTHSIGH